ncbi:hypothetical protein HELRODRAFT_169304 [Helobdella robusta]|uniref:Uncharacterized protein n=1 Tax=Helobdella robusta TaxID=6412 RepID=T1F1R5_HELRO|nr:hypothetical protein HELRODRAFT_169304 [Helobdella robusta]ESO08457.1 hypothetical protein HELRODRAFT_169304 [Helobdella robusta]
MQEAFLLSLAILFIQTLHYDVHVIPVLLHGSKSWSENSTLQIMFEQDPSSTLSLAYQTSRSEREHSSLQSPQLLLDVASPYLATWFRRTTIELYKLRWIDLQPVGLDRMAA